MQIAPLGRRAVDARCVAFLAAFFATLATAGFRSEAVFSEAFVAIFFEIVLLFVAVLFATSHLLRLRGGG